MIPTLRNNGLKGRVVVIAAERSGKCGPSELTQTFVAEEAVVYTTDHHPDILKHVETDLQQYVGCGIRTYPLDFRDPTAIAEFVAHIKEKEGRLDVLVTDFGLLEFVPHLKPFHQQSPDEWDRQYRYIVENVFVWCKAVIPFMIEQKFGRIIHITSEAARLGTPRMSVYGACKAAVAGFTRSLAAELAPHGITANCVSMGIQEIENRSEKSLTSRNKLEKIRNIIPLRRFGEPEELSWMAAYLASDLGAYITGQNLSVSGGMVMS